jgi:chromosome segregation ATPase
VRSVVAPPLAPAEEEASVRLDIVEARLAETEARLAEKETALTEARRRVSQAQAEVLRMSARAQSIADQKETEMGRLESGAIAALETTMAAHRKQVSDLEQRAEAAEKETHERAGELDAERHRSAYLQSMLDERDEHLALLKAKGSGAQGRA